MYLFNCYSLLSKDEGSTLDDIKCTGKAAPSGTVQIKFNFSFIVEVCFSSLWLRHKLNFKHVVQPDSVESYLTSFCYGNQYVDLF